MSEYYMKQLEAEGLESFFFDDEVMPLYKKVTIPMEKAGVKLDLPLITRLNEEIQLDIEKLQWQIEDALMNLPETQEYLKNKVLELSKLDITELKKLGEEGKHKKEAIEAVEVEKLRKKHHVD